MIGAHPPPAVGSTADYTQLTAAPLWLMVAQPGCPAGRAAQFAKEAEAYFSSLSYIPMEPISSSADHSLPTATTRSSATPAESLVEEVGLQVSKRLREDPLLTERDITRHKGEHTVTKHSSCRSCVVYSVVSIAQDHLFRSPTWYPALLIASQAKEEGSATSAHNNSSNSSTGCGGDMVQPHPMICLVLGSREVLDHRGSAMDGAKAQLAHVAHRLRQVQLHAYSQPGVHPSATVHTSSSTTTASIPRPSAGALWTRPAPAAASASPPAHAEEAPLLRRLRGSRGDRSLRGTTHPPTTTTTTEAARLGCVLFLAPSGSESDTSPSAATHPTTYGASPPPRDATRTAMPSQVWPLPTTTTTTITTAAAATTSAWPLPYAPSALRPPHSRGRGAATGAAAVPAAVPAVSLEEFDVVLVIR